MAFTGEGFSLFFPELLNPADDRVCADTQFLGKLGPGLAGLVGSVDHFDLELGGKKTTGTAHLKTSWLCKNSLFEMSEIGRQVQTKLF